MVRDFETKRENVLVTAANSDYYDSLLTLINTFLVTTPDLPIYLDIWDLGMSQYEIQIIKLCSPDRIRVLNVSDYYEEPFAQAFRAEYECFAWKPFCIRRSLEEATKVIWVDAGIAFSNSVMPIFEELNHSPYFFLENDSCKNIEYTSPECISVVSATEDELSANQIHANILGFNSTDQSRELLRTWRNYCSLKKAILSDLPTHRHDQSILSILIARGNLRMRNFDEYALEGLDYQLAIQGGKLILAHRRTFSWYDLNIMMSVSRNIKDESTTEITLSLITLCLNNPDDLRRTAQSIRLPRDVEWIVVDGGSRELELLEIEDIAHKGNAKLLHGPDRGIFHGMNRGVDHAVGEWVQFLNSGDCFENANSLENVMETLLKKNPIWLMGEAFGVDKFGVKLWKWPIPKQLRLLLGVNSYCHQAIILKRAILTNEGKFSEDSLYSDWISSLQVLAKHGKPIFFPNMQILFLVGGISAQQSIEYWVKESSRLRIRAGMPLGGWGVIDRVVQRFMGFWIQTKRGQLIRPDLQRKEKI